MHKIFIGGFGWSGSGAVIDMLAQYEGLGYVRRVFEETSFLKGRFSITALYARAKNGEILTKTDFINMYGGISSLNTLIQEDIPDSEKINLARNSLLHNDLGFDLIRLTHDLLIEGCSLLDEEPEPEAVVSWFEARIPIFFDQLVNSLPLCHFEGEKRVVLFNNDPSGYNTHFGCLQKPDLTILVYRDLRDVFASHLKGNRYQNTQDSARKFYQHHRRVTRSFHERLKKGCFEPNTCLVDFDEFVGHEKIRDRIVAMVPGLGDKVRESYDIERSRGNVGLRNKLDIGEDLKPQMQLIEDNFLSEWSETMAACDDLLVAGGGARLS